MASSSCSAGGDDEATAYVRLQVRHGLISHRWEWRRVVFTAEKSLATITGASPETLTTLVRIEDIEAVTVLPSLASLPASHQPLEPPPVFKRRGESAAAVVVDPPSLLLRPRSRVLRTHILICVIDKFEQQRWALYLSDLGSSVHTHLDSDIDGLEPEEGEETEERGLDAEEDEAAKKKAMPHEEQGMLMLPACGKGGESDNALLPSKGKSKGPPLPTGSKGKGKSAEDSESLVAAAGRGSGKGKGKGKKGPAPPPMPHASDAAGKGKVGKSAGSTSVTAGSGGKSAVKRLPSMIVGTAQKAEDVEGTVFDQCEESDACGWLFEEGDADGAAITSSKGLRRRVMVAKGTALFDNKVANTVGVLMSQKVAKHLESAFWSLTLSDEAEEAGAVDLLEAFQPVLETPLHQVREYLVGGNDAAELRREERTLAPFAGMLRASSRCTLLLASCTRARHDREEAIKALGIMTSTAEALCKSTVMREVVRIVQAVLKYNQGAAPKGTRYVFSCRDLRKLHTVKVKRSSKEELRRLEACTVVHCVARELGPTPFETEVPLLKQAARADPGRAYAELEKARSACAFATAEWSQHRDKYAATSGEIFVVQKAKAVKQTSKRGNDDADGELEERVSDEDLIAGAADSERAAIMSKGKQEEVGSQRGRSSTAGPVVFFDISEGTERPSVDARMEIAPKVWQGKKSFGNIEGLHRFVRQLLWYKSRTFSRLGSDSPASAPVAVAPTATQLVAPRSSMDRRRGPPGVVFVCVGRRWCKCWAELRGGHLLLSQVQKASIGLDGLLGKEAVVLLQGANVLGCHFELACELSKFLHSTGCNGFEVQPADGGLPLVVLVERADDAAEWERAVDECARRLPYGTMMGYLDVGPIGWHGFVRGWKRRWCLADSNRHRLKFYRSALAHALGDRSLGRVDLHDTAVRPLRPRALFSESAKLGFETQRAAGGGGSRYRCLIPVACTGLLTPQDTYKKWIDCLAMVQAEGPLRPSYVPTALHVNDADSEDDEAGAEEEEEYELELEMEMLTLESRASFVAERDRLRASKSCGISSEGLTDFGGEATVLLREHELEAVEQLEADVTGRCHHGSSHSSEAELLANKGKDETRQQGDGSQGPMEDGSIGLDEVPTQDSEEARLERELEEEMPLLGAQPQLRSITRDLRQEVSQLEADCIAAERQAQLALSFLNIKPSQGSALVDLHEVCSDLNFFAAKLADAAKQISQVQRTLQREAQQDRVKDTSGSLPKGSAWRAMP